MTTYRRFMRNGSMQELSISAVREKREGKTQRDRAAHRMAKNEANKSERAAWQREKGARYPIENSNGKRSRSLKAA